MKHTRIRKILLCLILTASYLLSSCGVVIINDRKNVETTAPQDDTVETTASAETTKKGQNSGGSSAADNGKEEVSNEMLARRYFSSVQRKQFDGMTFIITTTKAETLAPETVDTVISQARYERNARIETKFDLKLVTKVTDAQTIQMEAKNAYLADRYYTDLFAVPQQTLGNLYAEGLLMNLRTLPYLDLSAAYFNQSSVKACSGGFGVYGVSGEGIFEPDTLTGVYINKDLIRGAGLELPYAQVYSGEWTWTRYFELATATLASLDDTAGIYSMTSMDTDRELARLAYSASGMQYMESEVMSVPHLGFTPDSAASVIETLKALLSDSTRFVSDDTEASLHAFSGGSSVYLIDRLYVMSWMTNLSTDWGLVPLPKASETQESYQTLASDDTLLFGAMTNNVTAEATSLVLQGINALSYGHLTDQYISHHMNYVLRDNDSVNLLELITQTQTFDFGAVFGVAYPSVSDASVSSIYRAALGESLQTLHSRYATVLTQAMESAFPLRN